MLTIRQIEIFRTVLRAGTISAAARELHVSQPTVTKSLARMEVVLKLKLFQRAAGRVTPTLDAQRLLAETDAPYAELQLAIGRVAQATQTTEGLLRVGAQPSLANRLAAESLAVLMQRFPKASVHLDVLSVAEAIGYLRSGTGECALTVFPVLSADVASFELGAVQAVALVPRSSKLSQSRAPLTAKAAAREAIITFEPHVVHGRLVHDFFATANIVPVRTHMVRFANSAVALAEAGLGVAIVDKMTALSANDTRVVMRPLAFDGVLRAYLHRPMNRTPSRLLIAFEAAARERFDALNHALRL